MTTQPIRRTLSLLAAFAMISTMAAAPAAARAPSDARATASIVEADRLVLAGEGRSVGEDPFDVVVRNSGSSGLPLLGGGGPTINWIQVLVPTWHTALGDTVTVTGGSGTWTTSVDHANGRIIAKGGSLASGQSLTLSYGGTVTDQLADDDSGPVRVNVSEHGSEGPSSVANAPHPGALDIAIDVLDIPTISAVAPVGELAYGEGATFAYDATDGTVTAGQSNVDLAVDVQNLSTESKTVGLDSLSGVSSDAATVTPVTLAPKGGENAGAIAVDGVTFGGPGTTTVDASVSDADGASDRDGAGAPLNVTIERAATFARSTRITPEFFGVGEQTFTFDLSKTGAPSTLVDVALTFDSVLPGGSAPTATATDILVDRGARTVTASLPITWDPELGHTDGDFNAKAMVTGLDSNGAPVSVGPIDLGLVTFDSLQPFIRDLVLGAPAARVGEGSVATNGSTLTFAGTAIDPTHLDDDARCGGCDVVLELVGPGPDGEPKVYEQVTATSAADGGLSGSFTADSFEDRRVLDVRLLATVVDAAGNESEAPTPSNTVAVDTLRPAVYALGTEGNQPPQNWDDGQAGDAEYRGDGTGARVRALTGGESAPGEENLRVIDVIFDEPIGGGTSPLQWFVDSNGRNLSVQSAEIVENRKVRLTLREDLGRNARAVVTYDPALALGGQRIFDRAGLTLNKGFADTIDNIVPLPVSIDLVDKLEIYDAGEGEKFFTNVSRYTSGPDGSQVKERKEFVEFVVGEVASGSTVTIDIVDGSATRTVEYSNPSTSDQSNVSLSYALHEVFGGTAESPSLSDRELRLDVSVSDSGPKESTVTSFPLVLDRADPTSAGFTIDSAMNHVVVDANEALRYGLNASGDWLIGYMRNGRYERLPVNEVNNGGLNQRRLAVDPNAYRLSRYDVVDAAYVPQNSPDRRYRDAAGNRLAAGTIFAND